MPNYVLNQLNCKFKSVEELRRFQSLCFKGDKFTFNILIPIPDELREVNTGCRRIDGKDCYAWYKRMDENGVRMIPADTKALKKKYGYESSSHFCCIISYLRYDIIQHA